ncbi:MAG TPA: cyclic nucleotide-gated ion channel [Rhizomicrobium sp.]|jgi:voltage-gated potassium channel|nr:cyclic nucleotide-gated ion channel [Rhizomicrobium sp.]
MAAESELGDQKERHAVSAATPQNLRQSTYAVLEEGQLESLGSRIVEGILITLIVANVAAVAIETVPSINQHFHSFFRGFEYFSIGAYTIEYATRVWSSIEDPRVAARGPLRGRLAFALRPLMIVDFLAFAPSYLMFVFPIDLRLLRIFRLLRLVKLARYSQALPALLGVLYAERSALFASFILTVCVMCVSAALMQITEGSIQPKSFGTMPDAMYWAIATLTTVGYGDLVPITPLGRLIAGVTMVTGLLLFALPIGILANGFVSDLHRRQFAVTWSMMKRQPLFVGMDVEAVTEILGALSAKLVREHTQVAVTGQTANTLYLIVSGRAHLEGKSEAYDLAPGDVFGQEALQVGADSETTVTARSELRLLLLSGDDLRRLARKYPLLGRRLENKVAW